MLEVIEDEIHQQSKIISEKEIEIENDTEIVSNCYRDMPTLSQGDVNLTSQNWNQFKSQYSLSIIGIADSKCAECCQDEPLFAFIIKNSQNGIFDFNGKKIPVGRIDVSRDQKELEFLKKEDFSFSHLPQIIIMYYQQPYLFSQTNLKSFENFFFYLNRIINPTVQLSDIDELNQFVDDIDQQWQGDFESPLFQQSKKINFPLPLDFYQELRMKTRVVCFFFDKKEYEDEIKSLQFFSRILANRVNLRVGIVTNPKFIKQLKKTRKYINYFEENSFSSCALIRYDTKVIIKDLSVIQKEFNFLIWISENSKKEVEQLDRETLEIQQSIGTPMFIIFVDLEKPQIAQKCLDAMRVLEKVHQKYYQFVGFFYADNKIWGGLKKLLGITWDDLPSFAFNMHDKTQVVYPKDKPINSDALLNFFDRVAIHQDEELLAKSVGKVNYVLKELENTLVMNEKNVFQDFLAKDDVEQISLIFSSESDKDKQIKSCSNFNKFSIFIDQLLGLSNHLKISAFDTLNNQFPEKIHFILQKDLPVVYYFPKKIESVFPYKQLSSNITIINLIEFYIENSENKKQVFYQMTDKMQNLNKNGIKQFINLFNETQIQFPHELINYISSKYSFIDGQNVDKDDSLKTEL